MIGIEGMYEVGRKRTRVNIVGGRLGCGIGLSVRESGRIEWERELTMDSGQKTLETQP